jgi:hypothetical protein
MENKVEDDDGDLDWVDVDEDRVENEEVIDLS